MAPRALCCRMIAPFPSHAIKLHFGASDNIRGKFEARGDERGLTGELPCVVAHADADDWESRWTKSTWKQSEGTAGDFTLTAGKWYADDSDYGMFLQHTCRRGVTCVAS